MAPSILVVNGPNLNMLGTREPEIYGSETLADVEAACASRAGEHGLSIEVFQSNSEGAIVDAIQAARGKHTAIVINPGAYSHTSIAIHDAILSTELPAYEVHISNIHAREAFRSKSYVSLIAKAVICGLGSKGYLVAIDAIADTLGS